MTLRVALLQMTGTTVPAENVATVDRLAASAALKGARLVQTPEMTNIVERDRERLRAAVGEERDDPSLAALRDIARRHGVTLHVGSLALRTADGGLANRAFVIAPDGAIAARYDKIHLFDVDLAGGESWRESASYTGGAQAVLTEVEGLRLGLSICYDLRFPHLYRALAHAGALTLTAPACFTRQTGEAHWHVLQRARAIECGAWMLSAAQAGTHRDGRETFGHSIVVDPWGRIVAEAAGTGEAVIFATIDPAAAIAARARIPSLANERPFAAPDAVVAVRREEAA